MGIETNSNIIIEINNALAGWDPIGMQLSDPRWPYNEYVKYIPRIINAYLDDIPMYGFLMDLNLNMGLNKEVIESTKIASYKINYVLSGYSKLQIREVLPKWHSYLSGN